MKPIVICVTFFMLLVTSCGQKDGNDRKDEAVALEKRLTITREQFEASNLSFTELKKMEISDKVKVTGKITVNPDKAASVTSIVEGRVLKVFVSRGEWVKKGDPLLQLEGPAILELQQQFSEVDARLPVLQSDYERQKVLYREQVASQRTYLEAESLYRSALAKWQGLKMQLEMLGVDPDKAAMVRFSPSVFIYAPVDGNVTELNIINGMYIHPGTEFLQIADPEEVYADLNVYEEDFSGLQKGQQVVVYPIGDHKKSFSGTIETITYKVDDEKRSIAVQVVISGNDGHLVPGMFVDAEIVKQTEERYVLPPEAVAESGGKSYVLMKTGENNKSFELTQIEVNVSYSEDDFVVVAEPRKFSPDVKFLSKGVFALIKE